MSKIKILRTAVRLWSIKDVPAHINEHNKRQWAKSVLTLGDKWLYSKVYSIQEFKKGN